jgi:hypothetical protein
VNQSAEAGGTSQPKVCDTSAEALQRRVSRTSTGHEWAGQDSNPVRALLAWAVCIRKGRTNRHERARLRVSVGVSVGVKRAYSIWCRVSAPWPKSRELLGRHRSRSGRRHRGQARLERETAYRQGARGSVPGSGAIPGENRAEDASEGRWVGEEAPSPLSSRESRSEIPRSSAATRRALASVTCRDASQGTAGRAVGRQRLGHAVEQPGPLRDCGRCLR